MKADAAVSLSPGTSLVQRSRKPMQKRRLFLGPVSAVGEKGKKQGQIGKISVSEASPSGGLGRGKVFPLPRLLLGPLRSPIFSPISLNAETGEKW